MTEPARGAAQTQRPAEPWRQRLIRSLLYGRNVDRAAKARARVGFVIVAFVVIYAVIAGRLALFGLVNIDNQGIAGMEKWLDSNGLADLHRAGFATDRLQRPIELSVDLRVEHALRDELLKAKEKFRAKAASGLVSNVKTGEIVAMVSVPDFDPNNPKEAHDPDRINR